MTALGFDKYTEPLRVYLSKYREVIFMIFIHCREVWI